MKKSLLIIGILFISISSSVNAQWQLSGLATRAVATLAQSSLDTLFAGCDSFTYRSDNNGGTWQLATIGLPGNMGSRSIVAAGHTVYSMVNGANPGVYMSTDLGNTWNSTGGPTSYGGLVLRGNFVYRIMPESGVLRTVINTSGWVGFNNGLPNLCALAFGGTGSTLVVHVDDDGGGICPPAVGSFRNTEPAATWSSSDLPFGGIGSEQWPMVSIGTSLFSASAGDIYMSTDSGQVWNVVNTFSFLSRVSGLASSGNILFASVLGDGVFVSTSMGVNWTPINNGLPSLNIRTVMVNNQDLFAGHTALGVYKRSIADILTSISETEKDFACSVYPNPSKGTFHVSTEISSGQPLKINVLNSSGQIVYMSPEESMTSSAIKEIKLSNVAAGNYFVEIISGNKSAMKKIVVE